jgi:hypothetical protein
VPFDIMACSVKSFCTCFSYICLIFIGHYTLLEHRCTGRRDHCYYYSALLLWLFSNLVTLFVPINRIALLMSLL